MERKGKEEETLGSSTCSLTNGWLRSGPKLVGSMSDGDDHGHGGGSSFSSSFGAR